MSRSEKGQALKNKNERVVLLMKVEVKWDYGLKKSTLDYNEDTITFIGRLFLEGV